MNLLLKNLLSYTSRCAPISSKTMKDCKLKTWISWQLMK
jgi:hypothetical protein